MASKKVPVKPQAKNITPPSATGVPAKVPANPATKGSAMGVQKKAAGMAKRTANKPTTATGKRAKKSSDPIFSTQPVTIGKGKKGMYW